jgi:hypothetical protein
MKPDSAWPRGYTPQGLDPARKLSSPDDFTWVPWSPGWIAAGAIMFGSLGAMFGAVFGSVSCGALQGAAVGGIGMALFAAALGYVLDVFVLPIDWRTRQKRWGLRIQREHAREVAKAALRKPQPLVGRKHPAP